MKVTFLLVFKTKIENLSWNGKTLQVFLYILPIHKSSQSWWRVCCLALVQLPKHGHMLDKNTLLSFPFSKTIKVWVRVEIWRVCKEWDLLFLLQTFKNIICTITDKNFLQMYQLFVLSCEFNAGKQKEKINFFNQWKTKDFWIFNSFLFNYKYPTFFNFIRVPHLFYGKLLAIRTFKTLQKGTK